MRYLPTSRSAARGAIAIAATCAFVGVAASTSVAAAPAQVPAAAGAPTPPVAKAPARKTARGHKQARGRVLSCYAPLTGDWRNTNPNTGSLTRVLIDFDCQDVILCDIYGNCTGGDSAYYMRPYGRCHPTDCDWGRRRADDMGGGWIRAIYPFGFKTSYVWVKTYSYYGLTYLRVWTHNDFTPADGRTDYTTDEWFLR